MPGVVRCTLLSLCRHHQGCFFVASGGLYSGFALDNAIFSYLHFQSENEDVAHSSREEIHFIWDFLELVANVASMERWERAMPISRPHQTDVTPQLRNLNTL